MPTAAEPFGTVRDRAVYLPEASTLVAADLHLGRAATSAVDAPLDEGPAIVDRLLSLVERFEPAELVLAGDVLDAFDSVPREARSALDALLAGAENQGAALIVLEGNHDTQLSALMDGGAREVHELTDGTVVSHGHERPAVAGRRHVVGHDHPAIDIQGRRRPCFLFGQGVYEDADVLALPAFNPVVPGTAVNTWDDGDPLSPMLAEVPRLRPVVWDGKVEEPLLFPTLASLQPYLARAGQRMR